MMSSKILVSTRTVVSASTADFPSFALAAGFFKSDEGAGAAVFGASAAALAASFALL